MKENVFTKAVGSKELHQKLRSAKSSDELIQLAGDTGDTQDENNLAASMRGIATDALRKHGLPEWAIKSMFLGEPVCW